MTPPFASEENTMTDDDGLRMREQVDPKERVRRKQEKRDAQQHAEEENRKARAAAENRRELEAQRKTAQDEADRKRRAVAGVAAGAAALISLLVLQKAYHLTGGSAVLWIIPPAFIAFLVYQWLAPKDRH